MARYTGTVEAPHGPEEVWRYLADLRSVEEWDPSIDGVRLEAGEPRTEGARYRLGVRFGGRRIDLHDRVVSLDPPRRVVFEAETDSVSVRDEARIEPRGSAASSVTWEADLRLRGVRRVLDLPLRVILHRVGQKAKRGLRERLQDPTLAPPSNGRAYE